MNEEGADLPVEPSSNHQPLIFLAASSAVCNQAKAVLSFRLYSTNSFCDASASLPEEEAVPLEVKSFGSSSRRSDRGGFRQNSFSRFERGVKSLRGGFASTRSVGFHDEVDSLFETVFQRSENFPGRVFTKLCGVGLRPWVRLT